MNSAMGRRNGRTVSNDITKPCRSFQSRPEQARWRSRAGVKGLPDLGFHAALQSRFCQWPHVRQEVLRLLAAERANMAGLPKELGTRRIAFANLLGQGS